MELIYEDKKSIEKIEKKILACKSEFPSLKTRNKYGLFIKDDNFIAMSRLLDEYQGKVDLVYIDPPYNTKSIFYYDNKKISTISSSKNVDIAYKDNMTFKDYLEFIRERLILIHTLLSPKGTLYLHIDIKVGHYVKIILDEIFGVNNFINDITRVKSNPKNFSRNAYGNEKDVIYVYSKMEKNNIFNNVLNPISKEKIEKKFSKIDKNGKRYTTVPCHAPGETKNGVTGMKWKDIFPPKGRHWRYSPEELEKLDKDNRIEWSKNGVPRIIKYADEHNGEKFQDIWKDFKDPQYPDYPTQKNLDMLELIIKQSSNENSVIMDCFAGSASFLEMGLKNNRFVIGIDNSDIAYKLLLSNQNLQKIEVIIQDKKNNEKQFKQMNLFKEKIIERD